MPFNAYADIAQVAMAHRIRIRRQAFLEPIPFDLSDHLRDELAFALAETPFVSESAVCESLIYPILRDVWKPYRAELTLWSHLPISYDADLSGVPDYIVSRRSPLGSFVPDQAYLLVVEAKRDNFDRGWGQCLAAMVAAQKLDDQADRVYHGIATNGRIWEVGRLEGDEFVQQLVAATIQEVDDLAAALNGVMAQCRDEAARPLATA